MITHAISGTVYGVVLNDMESLSRIGTALESPPYKEKPKAPVLYIKPANTVTTGDALIHLPEGTEAVEVGATLGLVLKRAAARLSPDEALSAVGGVALVGDLSLPHASYYRPAIREKCFDGACPAGTIVPLDRIGALDTLTLTTDIDGQTVDRRSLADLIRPPARLLADVSAFMTLAAGDVLLVGVLYQAPLARPGDRVSIRADGLNLLHFSIARQQGDRP